MKKILKRLLFVLALVPALPFILITWLESVIFGKKTERMFSCCKEIMATVPTIIGQYIRLAYYKSVCTHVGFDVSMLLGSMLAHRETIVRRGTIIGCYSIIGYANIGENTIFGARVSLVSGKYQHGRPGERKDKHDVEEQYTRIKVGDNCWIGEGAVILSNIGDNCTIAAGSVLLKDAPDGTTFMGNPARKASIQ